MSKYVYLNQDLVNDNNLHQFDVGIIQSELDNTAIVHFLRINQYIELANSDLSHFDIAETGDRFQNKVCDRCYKYLDTETCFENNRLKKGDVITKRPSCRECRKIKNGKSILTAHRKIWEEAKPKMGELFTCPICQKTTVVGIVKIVLDHNHHTGEVRGWLCESCNTGIGRFDDNPALVERAKLWLTGEL
ncbi:MULTISPECIES: endonuclease VII domain-containing protein [unclassified Moraxella]|uniref:endonuclease VII domain-containing protein n=1 Tax=unclassified Moraxella TaxID=2685852 RepID=UPI003AF61E5A